jgi:pSer/pThr/pTyr-binding forkhead associated (FHA) protein
MHEGKEIAITRRCFLIGRAPTCHLRPSCAEVSEHHCTLLIKEGQAFVRDLDSKTGTFINNRRLRGEIELLEGDWLRVGPLQFVVRIEAEEAEPAPADVVETPEATDSVPAPAGSQTPSLTAQAILQKYRVRRCV